MTDPLLQFCVEPREGHSVGTIIGGISAFVLGTAIAGATVFGVVSSQTDAPDESPANVNQPAAAIDYGSNS